MYSNDNSRTVNSIPESTEEIRGTSAVAQNAGEIKIGTVTDCFSLNVRNEPVPDAEVLCTIPCLAEVMIEEDESTDEFYKVCTASGIEGFCMNKYIAVQQ